MKYPSTSSGKFPFFSTEKLRSSYIEYVKGNVQSNTDPVDSKVIDKALDLFENTYGEFDKKRGKYTGILGRHMKINAESIKINDIVDELKKIIK